jgi:hypothetical protein
MTILLYGMFFNTSIGVMHMNAKQNFVVKSFKDAAIISATLSERMATVAQFIVTQCPNFLDDVPKEVKAELHEGWAVRWQELNPAVEYSTEWVPKKGGGFVATLAFALSYSQQAFGQLKNEDPVKHGVIKGVRDKFNKYTSNRMKDLKKAVRDLNPETRTRTQSDNFATFIEKTMDNIKTRCKNAVAREDSTADELKTRMAIEAFKNVINK